MEMREFLWKLIFVHYFVDSHYFMPKIFIKKKNPVLDIDFPL